MSKKAVYFTYDGVYIRPALLIRKTINVVRVIRFINQVIEATASKKKELP